MGLGGDADTVGAMCGALVGALHGRSELPRRWLDGMENGAWGRDALVELASELARVSLGGGGRAARQRP